MSTLDIRIRTAEEHDFDAVAVVWHESASEEGVGPPQMPTVDELRQRIEAEVRKGWRLFVAVWDNEIVGMLALKTEQKVLDQLFVRPDHIGKGLGLTLFSHAKVELPSGFTLHTASTNLRARGFYERLGMVFDGEGSHPRTDHPVSYYRWNPSC